MSQKSSSSRWSDDEVEKLRNLFPSNTANFVADELNRSEMAIKHKARRLGITKEDNYRVKRIIEETETTDFDDVAFANFIVGFVAGEGSFTKNSRGGPDSGERYVFSISLADCDEEILHDIKEYFGVGNVYTYDSRQKNWQDTAQYQVQSVGEIYNVIIPFFEEFGLYSTNKEEQYVEWRDGFLEQYDLTERFK